ncbi:hypothetical protein F4680DRAFT_443095 [Xylaria scruposa]|nr:hypothetical protein F4680DRAFT_443095 [Xylaria scruposa]
MSGLGGRSALLLTRPAPTEVAADWKLPEKRWSRSLSALGGTPASQLLRTRTHPDTLAKGKKGQGGAGQLLATGTIPMLHYLKYMFDGKVRGKERKPCLTSEGWLCCAGPRHCAAAERCCSRQFSPTDMPPRDGVLEGLARDNDALKVRRSLRWVDDPVRGKRRSVEGVEKRLGDPCGVNSGLGGVRAKQKNRLVFRLLPIMLHTLGIFGKGQLCLWSVLVVITQLGSARQFAL